MLELIAPYLLQFLQALGYIYMGGFVMSLIITALMATLSANFRRNLTIFYVLYPAILWFVFYPKLIFGGGGKGDDES